MQGATIKLTGMWVYWLATAKFMRQFEVSFHPLMCQTTQIPIFFFLVDGRSSIIFFIGMFVCSIFQVFPKVYPNMYFTTCPHFIAYGQLCVLCWCAGQRWGAMLLGFHFVDSQVPISILLLSVLLHITCIITVIVTCAAVVLISTVPVACHSDCYYRRHFYRG